MNQKRTYRVALHERAEALNPRVDGGAPRLGEPGVRRVTREALGEKAVRAQRMEDRGDLRRRELAASRLRQPLGDQRLEQPRLQPGVVEVREEASSSGHPCRGLVNWTGVGGRSGDGRYGFVDDGGGGKGGL
jgi:hypothetical protein